MATAQTIINRSLRILGQIGAGESPTTDETADALTALNSILDALRLDKLMCYAMQTETLTLVSTQSSYTIGPSGDLVTTRPVALEEAYTVTSNVSYPVTLITEDEYAAIPDKTATAAYPDRALFRNSMSNSTLIVFPVPNTSGTMKLVTRVPLTAFASAGTTVTLPPGWEPYLAHQLAIEIAPEYETQAAPSVVQMAVLLKAAVKRSNQQPSYLSTGLPLQLYGHRSRIETDQP